MVDEYRGILRRTNKRRSGTTGGAGLVGDLIDVFQPTRTHTVAEAERQRLDIVQAPSPDTGDGPVDLESGVIVIRTGPSDTP